MKQAHVAATEVQAILALPEDTNLDLKYEYIALTGVAHWVGCHPGTEGSLV